MNNSRLALGTVQFGLQYGISNLHGIPDDNVLSAILVAAKMNGIDLIDTAAAYGNAEIRIGRQLLDDFKVVSKFSKGGDPRSEVLTSLSNLQLQQMYGHLAHDTDDLIRDQRKWDEMQLLKSAGLVHKVGFSLYHPEQLEKCLATGMIPDIVQLPFSILDRKFQPYFDELSSIGCEIHVRSVFLQGLYLMRPADFSEKLAPLRPAIAAIRQIAEDNLFTVRDLALAYVLAFDKIDRVVMGVENSQQLIENAAASAIKISGAVKDELGQIQVSKPELLNPSVW